MKLERYTIAAVQQAQYYQLPKFLFKEPYLSALSNDAKVLYALLRSRHDLSVKNGWYNEKKEVFMVFTRKEMVAMLGCSKPTALKAAKELADCGLIQEESVPGYANRLFLMIPSETSPDPDGEETPSDSFSSRRNVPPVTEKAQDTHADTVPAPRQENCPTRQNSLPPQSKIFTPPVKIFDPPCQEFLPELDIINNNKNIYTNDIIQSINHSLSKDDSSEIDGLTYYEEKIKEIDEELDSIIATEGERTVAQRIRMGQLRSRRHLLERLQVDYRQLPLLAVEDAVRDQIDYEALAGRDGSCEGEKDLVDNIVALIAEKLHERSVNTDTKERYLQLESSHIEHIVESVKNYDKKIKNPKRFLERVLYNAAFSDGISETNLFATTYLKSFGFGA